LHSMILDFFPPHPTVIQTLLDLLPWFEIQILPEVHLESTETLCNKSVKLKWNQYKSLPLP
jgi:hypothetical protein